MSDLEDEIRDAQDELALAEIVLRDTIGNQFQCIAKSRRAMTGPWGGGSDKDMPTAIRKALFSLRQELAHEKARIAATPGRSADELPKPKKRIIREDDLA